MHIQGCLLSVDKLDKILVATHLDPQNCTIHVMDKAKNSLAKVWVQVHDGEVYLVIERSFYSERCVYVVPLAML